MERLRLAGVNGPGGRGSGYAVGGRLVLTSAHLTGPTGTRVTVFHPAGTGTATGRVVWAGTPGGRDDAALVLVHDSPHWQPPTTPVRWGRAVTDRPGIPCETWGTPDLAQRPGRAVETEQLRGRLNPGTGFVGNQHVIDLDQQPPQWPADGTSPFAGLSGAAVFCDRLLTGVVAADRAHSGHGRLTAVPAYVLHHDPAFRTALDEWDVGPGGGLRAAEFQDLADRAQDPDHTLRAPTPAALLQARHQIVPFHGRHDLLTEMTAWCRLGGFGAWLLHGPGGQGKTRLAHQLAHLLAADGWAVLWPRTTAGPQQLREIRHAAKPLLVVLDYAESRTDQITALVEAAADHPATSPLKLLLLARTDGDWWQQATTATSLAEDHLATARTHRLTALDDHPAARADRYHDAARALADTLPHVEGLPAHDWSTAAASLPGPDLDQDAYGNALTLHMTALADLLDAATPHHHDHSGRAATSPVRQEADLVEDRLLVHERRHWRQTAPVPAFTLATLETALAAAHLAGAADHAQADRLWQCVPALADQPRDRRNRVTAWLTALYPSTPGGPPWGTLQPDRLAERHIGRVLDGDPDLADHLLHGADDTQAEQLLTVYSRAAAHPVFHDRLDTHLTGLCVRRHHRLAPHTVGVATRTNHPRPLIDALDTVTGDPATSHPHLADLYGLLPHPSRRLAPTAVRLARRLVQRGRLLADADSDALPGLAGGLNNLSVRLSEVGRREESLTVVQEAVAISRTLAEADPDAHLPDLALSLANLSSGLNEVGRREEGLAAAREAVAIRRTLAEADPDAHLPGLALALNNLSILLGGVGRREEGLATGREAVAIRRTLAGADPDAFLPELATSLDNLSNSLGETGRREEGLATGREAVAISRTLAEADPDAHLPELARALNNLSIRLGETGRRESGLEVVQEAVAIRRRLAGANPDAYLPNLARALANLSVRLGGVGRREEALAVIQEAVGHYRALAGANPDAYLSELARALNNLCARLGEMGRREEALAVIREAVAIRRTLAGANPDAHLPNLATSLANLSVRLGGIGRREEALAVVQEAVGHYRALAGANPDAYLPELARALNNLCARLSGIGRREEALAVIREAVAIRRTLAEANPDAHLPNLAASLTNLSAQLADAGRQEEALAVAQEGIGHYRALAEANPDAHLPDLARALSNMSGLLGEMGRREDGLAVVREAVALRSTLANANPDRFEADLRRSLAQAAWLEGLE